MCWGCAGWSGPPLPSELTTEVKTRFSLRSAGLEGESPEELNLGESLGVLQKGGGVGQKGAFLLAGVGLTIQRDGDGGAVMQQAANGAFGRNWGGVGGVKADAGKGGSGVLKVMPRS